MPTGGIATDDSFVYKTVNLRITPILSQIHELFQKQVILFKRSSRINQFFWNRDSFMKVSFNEDLSLKGKCLRREGKFSFNGFFQKWR